MSPLWDTYICTYLLQVFTCGIDAGTNWWIWAFNWDPIVCLISGGWFSIVFFGFQFAYKMGMHMLILSDPLIFCISLSWLWVFLLSISMYQTTLNLSDLKHLFTVVHPYPWGAISTGVGEVVGGEDIFQDPQWKPETSDHMDLCIYYFFLYRVGQKYIYSSYGK